ncbi:MAG: OmpA family protein [Alistipes sp.]|nr:OmpA family protein [Alistipes sp.]
MRRFVLIALLLLMGGVTEVEAQSFLKQLGKTVENAAKRKVQQKAEEKTEKAVEDIMDGNIIKGKKDKDKAAEVEAEVEETAPTEEAPKADAVAKNEKQKSKTAEMTWNKFDFVSGDEIMFEDNQANEQVGEFPSQWDVLRGSAEILSINGEKCFEILNEGAVIPLMKDKHYLPELFTVEFDYFFRDEKVADDNGYKNWGNAELYVEFYDANDEICFQMRFYPHTRYNEGILTGYYLWSVSGENRPETSLPKIELTSEEWHRISISFNKRALKLYMDETRLFNIPNMTAPASFRIGTDENADKHYFIKNVRIAKGAVPLYDRMMTDGKFITYGITFDVGKSTIKPESMGEINRIVQLMTENPDLKFSVEGHTDSTGKPESNQTLSEQRSKAIVDKLVELGIAKERLAAVGKGQNNPIADNNTDEGRAKNRRVEFVKM